jgi:hypothetical protein
VIVFTGFVRPAILLIIGLVLYFLLTMRYSKHASLLAAALVVVANFGVTVIVSRSSDMRYPVEWHRLTTLASLPIEFQYQPRQGLFVRFSDNSISKIVDAVPACQPNGPVAACLTVAKDQPINISKIKLDPLVPDPPDSARLQIMYYVRCPVTSDVFGYTSFAVLSNNEVWCTEQVTRGGPGNMEETFSVIVQTLSRAVLIFCTSLVLSIGISIVVLERRRRRKAYKQDR